MPTLTTGAITLFIFPAVADLKTFHVLLRPSRLLYVQRSRLVCHECGLLLRLMVCVAYLKICCPSFHSLVFLKVFYDKLVGIKYGTPEEVQTPKKSPKQEQQQEQQQQQLTLPGGSSALPAPPSSKVGQENLALGLSATAKPPEKQPPGAKTGEPSTPEPATAAPEHSAAGTATVTPGAVESMDATADDGEASRNTAPVTHESTSVADEEAVASSGVLPMEVTPEVATVTGTLGVADPPTDPLVDSKPSTATLPRPTSSTATSVAATPVTPSTESTGSAVPASASPVTPMPLTTKPETLLAAAVVTPMDVDQEAAAPKPAPIAVVTPAAKLEDSDARRRPRGEAATAGAATENGVFRVSMRLSNEMPEFMVVTSKYDEAVKFPWRSEMHIQMAFMEEPGGCRAFCCSGFSFEGFG